MPNIFEHKGHEEMWNKTGTSALIKGPSAAASKRIFIKRSIKVPKS